MQRSCHTSPLQIETANADTQMGSGKMHVTPERRAGSWHVHRFDKSCHNWVQQIGNNDLGLWIGNRQMQKAFKNACMEQQGKGSCSRVRTHFLFCWVSVWFFTCIFFPHQLQTETLRFGVRCSFCTGWNLNIWLLSGQHHFFFDLSRLNIPHLCQSLKSWPQHHNFSYYFS